MSLAKEMRDIANSKLEIKKEREKCNPKSKYSRIINKIKRRSEKGKKSYIYRGKLQKHIRKMLKDDNFEIYKESGDCFFCTLPKVEIFWK